MNANTSRKDEFKKFVAADPPIYGDLGMRPELVGHPTDDERIWLELEPEVGTRPLMFDMTTGSRCEILRVRKGGILSRHRHPSPVHGYVLKGNWHYLEHSWVATEGSYVFEPPGEEHTLVCGDCDEMQTFFFLHGPVLYVDDDDNVTFVEDNLSMIRLYREHYDKVGLGADFVDQLIR